MTERKDNSIPHTPIGAWESPLLKREGARHLFPTRKGGVSEGAYDSLNFGGNVGDEPWRVEENHQRLARAVGLNRQKMFTVYQVHGREVVVLSPGEARQEVAARKADAVIARGEGVGVGVRTADCAPILLFDREGGAVAAVHAGWRGTVADVVGAAVSALSENFGVRPHHLAAAIGPCIGPCCFEVGPEVLGAFAEAFDSDAWRGEPRPEGKGTVDLYAANEMALLRAGVTDFESLRTCTRCQAEDFFSYRRDGQRSGRHLSVIVSGG